MVTGHKKKKRVSKAAQKRRRRSYHQVHLHNSYVNEVASGYRSQGYKVQKGKVYKDPHTGRDLFEIDVLATHGKYVDVVEVKSNFCEESIECAMDQLDARREYFEKNKTYAGKIVTYRALFGKIPNRI